MNLAICSLASGSSGNCYVVYSEDGCILVDAGISAKQIREGLLKLGIGETDLKAVLVTHDHSDHVKGLGTLLKRTDAKIYANEKTFKGIDAPISEERWCGFETGSSFELAGMLVETFSVSHDTADPVGYSFSRGGKRISIVTDTGIVTPAVFGHIKSADILVLESNHDENILRMGRYPWFLKQRILGEKGHLSNEAAAFALAEALKQEKEAGSVRDKMVLLAHLSKENNFPEMAMATMNNILEEKNLLNRNLKIQILSRSDVSPIYFI